MDRSASIQKETDKVILQAESELNSSDSALFSRPAFNILKAKISQYISELVNQSIKVSKRHRSDTVSAAHVERASDYLVSSTSRRFFRHLGTIGGILLGASISNILTMTLNGQYSTIGTILSAGLGIVGAFAIALNIAKD